MTPVVYYYGPNDLWIGYWSTPEFAQISEVVEAHSRDEVLIELGAIRDKAAVNMIPLAYLEDEEVDL